MPTLEQPIPIITERDKVKLLVIRGSEDVRSIRDFHDKIEMNLQSLEAIGVEPESCCSLLVPMIKDKIPNELNIHISCKSDASVDAWKINDLMRELKLEIEARETIGDTKRVKSQRTPRDTVEGLLSVDKITCPFCQQDHFADRCNIVTNVNTRKKILQCQSGCYICTKRGTTQEIVKAREHVFDAKDDIILGSVKEIKTIQDNKLIMIKVTIQRRVTTMKIAKEIMRKRNNQTYQELQPRP